jgi:O-acetylhomoserine/O-acetylserine sulfhydrylase-like pyridoxal-dependent enzyme
VLPLLQSAVYSGTHALVHHHFPRLGITYSEVDIDAHPDTWTPLLQPNTKVRWRER